ncbi:YjgN family protein [Leptospira neocaledonica]|uniref:DUF898 domain-containing protein n=1 Tax=Leptospira neocaledonica TaxID=2023192 RepID=A0A2N0A214_9LEPT|nr:DUF898 family protein [Leptospira neocaledonica]PJZ78360.1 hypothetical protein CH365_03360 [Leptospira neocaledonica]
MENSTTRAKFDGDGWELLKLYLFNALATISTLGIYSFWARVRVERYLRQHTAFLGQRFDFHATGLERFLGFLKAAPIAIILFCAIKFPLQWWVFSPEFETFSNLIPAFLLLYLLGPFIFVGRLRFHLSRTSYNNIRFHFAGRVLELVKIFLVGIPLTILTFGFYSPWFTIRLKRFQIENTYYGNAGFKFDGTGGSLFWIHLKGFLLLLPTLGFYASWWQANVYNYYWNRTTVNGIRFKSNLKGEDVLVYTIISYVSILFTLGLAFPWIAVIWYKLFYEAISLEVEPDLSQIQPEYDKGASALAEGFESSLEALADIFD